MANGIAKLSAPSSATIRDVAKLCGLSITTVSHALGNGSRRSRIPDFTVQRVTQAAKELNYKPSWRGQALAQRRSNQIGMLYRFELPEMRAVYYELMSRLNERLLASGYHLMFVPMHGDDWMAQADDPRFDACVLADAESEEDVTRMLVTGQPAVLLNSVDDPRCSSVVFDDVMGAKLAVDHLVSLGHRDIAYCFCGGHLPKHRSVAERKQSFLNTMASHGLGANARCFHGPASECFKDVKFGQGGITAVVGYADSEVIDILAILQRRGLRVPQDVSLIGFNDIPPMDRLFPAMTCVRVPGDQMGIAAADLLLEQLSGETKEQKSKEARRVVVPETLVVRESTAPPPAAIS
jgi:LacI family transcriptional regulator